MSVKIAASSVGSCVDMSLSTFQNLVPKKKARKMLKGVVLRATVTWTKTKSSKTRKISSSMIMRTLVCACNSGVRVFVCVDMSTALLGLS